MCALERGWGGLGGSGEMPIPPAENSNSKRDWLGLEPKGECLFSTELPKAPGTQRPSHRPHTDCPLPLLVVVKTS